MAKKLLSCEHCGVARHGMIKSAVIRKQDKDTYFDMKTVPLCYACFIKGISECDWKDLPEHSRKLVMESV